MFIFDQFRHSQQFSRCLSSNRLTTKKMSFHLFKTGGKQLSSSVFKRVTDQHILGRLSVAARTHVSVIVQFLNKVQIACIYTARHNLSIALILS